MGNDQRSNGSSSSSSSKKNKSKSKSSSNSSSNNNSNSEKPKQPQRGLGVAQLEKIRLHTQMANCGFFPQQQQQQQQLLQLHHHPGFPTGPFPSPLFPHVHEDMRMQAAALQPPVIPYGFVGPPSCSPFPYGYHHPNNFMMGVGEHMERTCSIRFGESHPPMTTRYELYYIRIYDDKTDSLGNNKSLSHLFKLLPWNSNNNVPVIMAENQQYMQPQGLVTRHLLSHVEENTIRHNLFESNGSCSQNLESSSSGKEEPDLELKLSL
ncbi:protein SPEAR1-like [Silene latifolia]|uniref:protein SPEAR1-like n=1 Tax=Silene latifolia TaxID=37657 RepID=UPI003D77623B